MALAPVPLKTAPDLIEQVRRVLQDTINDGERAATLIQQHAARASQHLAAQLSQVLQRQAGDRT